ncbi:MAG TPA: hypothetical protein VII06_09535 [Chloroflexota bacterium]|jgi:hypothetical protein
MTALEPLIGTVSKVNGTAFWLAERPALRLAISQFAEPRPELPAVGQRVRLGLDSKQFVRAIEVVGEDRAPDVTAPATSREATSTRLACLKAAAEFLAPRAEAKSPDVLAVAAAFEAWVTR